uniref:Uncharacterized protein n=1 Tax=Chromera velia CCMP2878 TaxID=1169474 RepID=A0A0G4H8G9_9ALVE|eukprot:Cvel_25103.t1-p1 / transcript=Cvel_25103.t1 / gene=Cvel_25103 / organism=Chromera_velia_CCMP2878 / gene_product=hypothetical protein / transcript_product=hypothetical protein / location=Cvel_scaffold2800:20966-21804(-) / protein_length=188 / sequence_SO=supercontig / SO=protein_coding / is_pseudo=false
MSRRRIARPGPSGETGENTDVQGFQRESIEGDPICESQGAEDAGNGAADTVVVDHTAGFAPGAMDPINPLRDTSNQVLQIAGNVIHRLVVQKSTSRLAHLHDIRETRPLAGKDTTEKMEKGLDMKGDPQQPEEKGARVTFPESSGEENHKDSHQLDTWNDQGIAEEEATVSPVASQKLSRPGDRGAPK